MNRFIDFYQKHTKTITESRLTDERVKMIEVRGMYDDTDGFQDNVPIIKKAIMGDVMNEVVLQDKQIQKMDLALEKLMKNGGITLKCPSQKQMRRMRMRMRMIMTMATNGLNESN